MTSVGPRCGRGEQPGRAAWPLGLVVIVGAIAGCGRGLQPQPPPGLVPVAGRVVLGGKALPRVLVTLFDDTGAATAAEVPLAGLSFSGLGGRRNPKTRGA